jgi:hypothetical protein
VYTTLIPQPNTAYKINKIKEWYKWYTFIKITILLVL